MCNCDLSTDGCSALAKIKKPESKSVEAGKAASWQQILEYNTSQNTTEKLSTKNSTREDARESKNVTSDSRDVCSSSLAVLSPEDKRHSLKDDAAADNPDGRHCLTVEAVYHSGQGDHVVDTLSQKSRSAQNLTKQPEVLSPHHRSTESLLKNRPGTLPQLDRLRMEDSRVLSRRRSFSGTLFKAAAAVAVHYRGLRDSLKAASADLINDVRDGGQDKLTSRSDRVSSDNLGQHATTLC